MEEEMEHKINIIRIILMGKIIGKEPPAIVMALRRILNKEDGGPEVECAIVNTQELFVLIFNLQEIIKENNKEDVGSKIHSTTALQCKTNYY